MRKLSSLSVVFPAYNDEKTIGGLVRKVLRILPKFTDDYEIIIVNDGSTDTTGEVLAKLQKQTPSFRVITHERNLGYGAALTRGFREASKALIFYTDGDGQYDVEELINLVGAFDDTTDMVTGYKLKRSDPWFRRLLGSSYNWFVRFIFQLRVRDVDCNFRLFRKRILEGIRLRVKSGAFDAELMKKLTERGIRFKEVPVHHYPRLYGSSQVFTLPRVFRSLFDLGLLWFGK